MSSSMVAAAATTAASRKVRSVRIHLLSAKPAGRRRTLCPSNTPRNRAGGKGWGGWFFLATSLKAVRPSKREITPSLLPPSPNSLLPALVSSPPFLRLCVCRALWRSAARIRRFTNPWSYRRASSFLGSLCVQPLLLTMLHEFASSPNEL